MESYPIMLNLERKKAVIVGGGKVAYKKTCSLLLTGAKITVISPTLNTQMKKLLDEKRLTWKQKKVEPHDIAHAFLIIAATNNKMVNKQIATQVSNNQLVNIADNLHLSNFHLPAKMTRGKLTIAVATGGASPKLAKKIRDELAITYDESYEQYVQFLAHVREQLKQVNINTKAKETYLEEILHPKYKNSQRKQRELLALLKNEK